MTMLFIEQLLASPGSANKRGSKKKFWSVRIFLWLFGCTKKNRIIQFFLGGELHFFKGALKKDLVGSQKDYTNIFFLLCQNLFIFGGGPQKNCGRSNSDMQIVIFFTTSKFKATPMYAKKCVILAISNLQQSRNSKN